MYPHSQRRLQWDHGLVCHHVDLRAKRKVQARRLTRVARYGRPLPHRRVDSGSHHLLRARQIRYRFFHPPPPREQLHRPFFAIIFFFPLNFRKSKAASATLFFNIIRGYKGLFVTSNRRWQRAGNVRSSPRAKVAFFGAWGLPPGVHNTKGALPRASERSWRAEVHRRTAAICTVTQGV